MKNYLWIFCLILAVVILCLFTYKVATTNSDEMFQSGEIEAIVLEHTVHTHDHAGLACCPCGACHKPDSENKNGIRKPAWWLRLIALSIFMTTMISAITGMFWC